MSAASAPEWTDEQFWAEFREVYEPDMIEYLVRVPLLVSPGDDVAALLHPYLDKLPHGGRLASEGGTVPGRGPVREGISPERMAALKAQQRPPL